MAELDARTLAYINLYAVLGALENLCEIDGEAKKLASRSSCRLHPARNSTG